MKEDPSDTAKLNVEGQIKLKGERHKYTNNPSRCVPP